jgi:hypothetical protein
MMSSIESTSNFNSKLVPNRSRYARRPTAARKLSAIEDFSHKMFRQRLRSEFAYGNPPFERFGYG